MGFSLMVVGCIQSAESDDSIELEMGRTLGDRRQAIRMMSY